MDIGQSETERTLRELKSEKNTSTTERNGGLPDNKIRLYIKLLIGLYISCIDVFSLKSACYHCKDNLLLRSQIKEIIYPKLGSVFR